MSRRKYSSIWLYFEDEGGKRARCKFCNKMISYLGGSQGNLNRHMKLKHPSTAMSLDEVEQATKNLIKQEFGDNEPSTSRQSGKEREVFTKKVVSSLRIEPLQTEPEHAVYSTAVTELCETTMESVQDNEAIDRQLLRMIIRGQHSFRLVEEPAFKELIQEVSKSPGYTLPTRKRLSTILLPKVHKELLEDVKEQIRSATDVCLAFDKWLSRANECYAALTAHYINANTELKSHLLACQPLKNGHSAHSLYAFLQNVIADFSISNKITVIVSDNTPEMADAIAQGDWLGISCFGHSLNTTVQEALQGISDTINKIRKIAEYSSTNVDELHEMVNISKINLKQDDPNRWTTTYEMLQNINQMQDTVILTISANDSELMLSSKDWEIISETLPILKPFYEVVKEISAEKNLYLSKVTVLCNILETYVSQNFPINEEVAAILTSLQLGLFSYFGSIRREYLYAESALLDPRFKRRGFRDDDSYNEAVRNLSHKISSLKLSNESEQFGYSMSNGVTVKTESLWNDYDMEFKKNVKHDTEFDKYLNEEYLDRKMDPILWWKQRKCIYPSVYLYAIKRLCIVATSVPCDRIFSPTGQILTERRTLLKPSTIEGLVFLHNNM